MKLVTDKFTTHYGEQENMTVYYKYENLSDFSQDELTPAAQYLYHPLHQRLEHGSADKIGHHNTHLGYSLILLHRDMQAPQLFALERYQHFNANKQNPIHEYPDIRLKRAFRINYQIHDDHRITLTFNKQPVMVKIFNMRSNAYRSHERKALIQDIQTEAKQWSAQTDDEFPAVPFVRSSRYGNDKYYVFMPHYGSTTLADLIAQPTLICRNATPIKYAQALHNLIQSTLADLKRIHERHIAHRDLKPANIMVVNTGAAIARIIDFGSAKTVSVHGQVRAQMGGTTPAYFVVTDEIYQSLVSKKVDGAYIQGKKFDFVALLFAWRELADKFVNELETEVKSNDPYYNYLLQMLQYINTCLTACNPISDFLLYGNKIYVSEHFLKLADYENQPAPTYDQLPSVADFDGKRPAVPDGISTIEHKTPAASTVSVTTGLTITELKHHDGNRTEGDDSSDDEDDDDRPLWVQDMHSQQPQSRSQPTATTNRHSIANNKAGFFDKFKQRWKGWSPIKKFAFTSLVVLAVAGLVFSGYGLAVLGVGGGIGLGIGLAAGSKITAGGLAAGGAVSAGLFGKGAHRMAAQNQSHSPPALTHDNS